MLVSVVVLAVAVCGAALGSGELEEQETPLPPIGLRFAEENRKRPFHLEGDSLYDVRFTKEDILATLLDTCADRSALGSSSSSRERVKSMLLRRFRSRMRAAENAQKEAQEALKSKSASRS